MMRTTKILAAANEKQTYFKLPRKVIALIIWLAGIVALLRFWLLLPAVAMLASVLVVAVRRDESFFDGLLDYTWGADVYVADYEAPNKRNKRPPGFGQGSAC